MKKALLLHGWECNSHSNWFPWLKKELEQQGYIVFVPDLPDSHSPILQDHLNTISHIVENFGKGDIIIGHSMGGKLAIHAVEKNNIRNINCILVGPSYDTIEDELDLGDPVEVKKHLIDYNSSAIDFQKINRLENRFSVLLSSNDRFIKVESATAYYNQLNTVEFVHFSNYGHFMISEGFEEFKDILEYI